MRIIQEDQAFMLEKYKKILIKVKKESNYRQLQKIQENYLDFSSNDYLGLSKNKDVIEAGVETAREYGAGSTGSRLLSGNKSIFTEFEEIIAKDKKKETALIFNSGFQANSGVLECLTDRETTVIFDKLNHASMYQGIFASGAKLIRFEHLDYNNLESILKNLNSQKVIIVSETVFGMDGDIADIKVLSDLSNKFNTLLYLDEAHATGLYGENGYGLSTNFQLNPKTTIIMGTFSKALGSSGAYIACSDLIKDYLLQKCRSFIYSTALSPFCIGAAMKAWGIVKLLSKTKENLFLNAKNLRKQLKSLNFDVIGNETNIIPILCEKQEIMKNIKNKCFQNGIKVSGITKPTSPTPRIRIAITATHTAEDIEKLVEIINEKQF
ncbi:MAG: pyridoxal phosphate-dependent aminotransferase family protein [Holosporales bacterium]|jgi:8-amino-7-oxononanoate synthase|nr:pyridoxal phosphate-dependent aminotransferase family protein [Holosporales bacterium]